MTYTGKTDEERERVATQFKFHKGTDITGPMHQEVRKLHRILALWILDNVPKSVEREAALKSLQLSMMWSNAAIAIHTEPEVKRDRDDES